MKKRYEKNLQSLSENDMEILFKKKACIIGCGGLGGYVAEHLSRIGVLHLTVVDDDVFDESNLNRQLFSSESNLGCSKAEAAKKRIADINSDVVVTAIQQRADAASVESIIAGHDIVIDALDNAPTRLLLADMCSQLGIPLVHGSIGGWYGQVASIFPGDNTLTNLYGSSKTAGIERQMGNLPFTASLVASLQCAEAVKILTDKGGLLKNSVLRIDLLNYELDIITMA